MRFNTFLAFRSCDLVFLFLRPAVADSWGDTRLISSPNTATSILRDVGTDQKLNDRLYHISYSEMDVKEQCVSENALDKSLSF